MLALAERRIKNKSFDLGRGSATCNTRVIHSSGRTFPQAISPTPGQSIAKRKSAFVTSIAFQAIRTVASMGPPRLETISASLDGDIGIIKYNRPKNANSISPAVFKDLLEAFTWATTESSVKVILYTGEGKFFTAGLDLVSVPKDGPVLSDESIKLLGYDQTRH